MQTRKREGSINVTLEETEEGEESMGYSNLYGKTNTKQK